MYQSSIQYLTPYSIFKKYRHFRKLHLHLFKLSDDPVRGDLLDSRKKKIKHKISHKNYKNWNHKIETKEKKRILTISISKLKTLKKNSRIIFNEILW